MIITILKFICSIQIIATSLFTALYYVRQQDFKFNTTIFSAIVTLATISTLSISFVWGWNVWN